MSDEGNCSLCETGSPGRQRWHSAIPTTHSNVTMTWRLCMGPTSQRLHHLPPWVPTMWIVDDPHRNHSSTPVSWLVLNTHILLLISLTRASASSSGAFAVLCGTVSAFRKPGSSFYKLFHLLLEWQERERGWEIRKEILSSTQLSHPPPEFVRPPGCSVESRTGLEGGMTLVARRRSQ